MEAVLSHEFDAVQGIHRDCSIGTSVGYGMCGRRSPTLTRLPSLMWGQAGPRALLCS